MQGLPEQPSGAVYTDDESERPLLLVVEDNPNVQELLQACFAKGCRVVIAADGQEVVGWHTPSFTVAAILLVLPAVIALIAENTGHVKAVAEMTGHDLDPVMGRAIAGDGVGTVLASSVGGSPTTTYAENIGVMAATRVYSTAAYWVAAAVATTYDAFSTKWVLFDFLSASRLSSASLTLPFFM